MRLTALEQQIAINKNLQEKIKELEYKIGETEINGVKIKDRSRLRLEESRNALLREKYAFLVSRDEKIANYKMYWNLLF